MLRYYYAWMPAALVVGTVVILSTPYLALLALTSVLLATITAIAALMWAVASTAYRLPGRLLYARRSRQRVVRRGRVDEIAPFYD